MYNINLGLTNLSYFRPSFVFKAVWVESFCDDKFSNRLIFSKKIDGT